MMTFPHLRHRGRGKTVREMILNEIKESRDELRRIERALDHIETVVRGKPDGGHPLFGSRYSPLLRDDQLTPLFGWVLSLYQSCVLIHSINTEPAVGSIQMQILARAIQQIHTHGEDPGSESIPGAIRQLVSTWRFVTCRDYNRS